MTLHGTKISRAASFLNADEPPEDATFDDAMERIAFLAKVEEGLRQSLEGKGIPHEEVKKRFLG